jgi:N-acetylmuramoyl-L-alanine amidase
VRGLRVDGICDELTWVALVEASWELGDRHLYVRTPPYLRGDDVAELQRVLGQLGFDAGRIDGIFGTATARALAEFQENVGLQPDGVCGYETFDALRRVGGRVADRPPVAAVREQEALRALTPRLSRTRVALGCFGGFDRLSRTLGRQLRSAGASVAELDADEGSAQAASANRFGADVYLGIAVAPSCSVSYYQVPGFESFGGRRLAQLASEHLFAIGFNGVMPRGMRLPILRETRMPAVLCELGPVEVVAARAPDVADALARAVREWVERPADPQG